MQDLLFNNIMEILLKILNEKNNRRHFIKEFQKIVWNDENASEILSELAYDLDFYEPDDNLRSENTSYYGDDRLEQEINLAINKINR